MAPLSKAKRASLPASAFAGPHRTYPIPDAKHAAVAKGLAAMHHAPNAAAINRKADAKLGHPHKNLGPYLHKPKAR